MKSLFLELWAVSCLQICPELSGERMGGERCRLFVEKERNCDSMVEYGVQWCVHVVERNCHLSTTGKMVYGSAKSVRWDNMMSRTTTGYEDKQTQRGYTSSIFSTDCLMFMKDTEISGHIYLVELQMQGYLIGITARSLTGRHTLEC